MMVENAGISSRYPSQVSSEPQACDNGHMTTLTPLATIAEVDPDFIFIHHFDDTHQDHRNLAKSTITATRYTRNVLFYEGPTTNTFTPTVFVDITHEEADKIAALEAHASQVSKTNIGDLSIVEVVHAAALFRGTQARVKSAEGFMPLRLFINVAPGE